MSTTTVNISAQQVKELRERTNAPMMDCRNALQEAKGDMEQAVVLLRKKGVATAARKASRTTSEGAVASYIHAGGKVGVLLQIDCQSETVAGAHAGHRERRSGSLVSLACRPSDPRPMSTTYVVLSFVSG